MERPKKRRARSLLQAGGGIAAVVIGGVSACILPGSGPVAGLPVYHSDGGSDDMGPPPGVTIMEDMGIPIFDGKLPEDLGPPVGLPDLAPEPDALDGGPPPGVQVMVDGGEDLG